MSDQWEIVIRVPATPKLDGPGMALLENSLRRQVRFYAGTDPDYLDSRIIEVLDPAALLDEIWTGARQRNAHQAD